MSPSSELYNVGAQKSRRFQVLLGDLKRYHFNVLCLSHPTEKAMYISRSHAKLNDVSKSIFSAKAYFPYYFFPSNCYSSRWLYWDLILHEKKK